jgi:glycosyltransferase involved in cell wall biosynthesis
MHSKGLNDNGASPASVSDAGAAVIPGLVSIVIPCYRGDRYLAEAIESCLQQTYEKIEVIVVDDASPDDCAAISERFARREGRVRVVCRPVNGGVARAFNSGFEVARGEYFTRLAQDDLFRKDAIAIMVGHARKHPEAGLVYCDQQTIDERGRVIGFHAAASPEEFRADRRCLGVCVLWPRFVWEKVGQFDPEFDAAEDYEYWLRIIRHFPMSKCQGEAPLFFRIHSLQGSNQQALRQEVAHWKARIRHCGSWWEARRRKSDCYAALAYIHRTNGNSSRALSCLLLSSLCWPFSPRPYRGLARAIGDPARRGAGLLLRKVRGMARTA